ncbi:protein of unknown function [Micropruina glycogenica]|uniref:Uncharacterized protein n=1 Tax=Micropruina glycogenica TaxID=75385 RepID=A0A2N9JCC0_9ACTN|nr:protein of unknown function [Micropruina glycogenica]
MPPTPQPPPNQPSMGEPPQETLWQRVRRRVIGPPESPH